METRMIQCPGCWYTVFVDTRGNGDVDYLTVRERNRDDARKTARNYRNQGCRTSIQSGHGGMTIVPDWYVLGHLDQPLLSSDYLSGNTN